MDAGSKSIVSFFSMNVETQQLKLSQQIWAFESARQLKNLSISENADKSSGTHSQTYIIGFLTSLPRFILVLKFNNVKSNSFSSYALLKSLAALEALCWTPIQTMPYTYF